MTMYLKRYYYNICKTFLAAHCFWYKGILSNNILINNDSYKVAIGKYNINFTIVDNDFTQILNVCY